MAFFVTWVLLHGCYRVVAGLLVPRNSERLPKTVGQWATVGLFYAIPLSSLLDVDAEPDALGFTIGFALYACGAALVIWAKLVNPHFVAEIKRPERVITTGPYKFLTHPGYLGFAWMGLGTCLMLGNKYGAIPLILYSTILCARARRENKILSQINT